jgi:ubiquinol-cytochrome c reductase iron-sulfur subunit
MTEPTRDSSRRLYLSVTLKFLLLLGFGVLVYPFIASLRTSNDANREVGSDIRPGIEVGLGQLAVSQIKRLEAYGRPVWILRRDPADVARLETTGPELRDADSRHSQQPEAARNAYRSLLPEFFVFSPLETKRQCQVRWQAKRSERGAVSAGEFTEPCYQARFDMAGRILKNTGEPTQQNLPVPEYEVVSPSRIRLLPPR